MDINDSEFYAWVDAPELECIYRIASDLATMPFIGGPFGDFSDQLSYVATTLTECTAKQPICLPLSSQLSAITDLMAADMEASAMGFADAPTYADFMQGTMLHSLGQQYHKTAEIIAQLLGDHAQI